MAVEETPILLVRLDKEGAAGGVLRGSDFSWLPGTVDLRVFLCVLNHCASSHVTAAWAGPAAFSGLALALAGEESRLLRLQGVLIPEPSPSE